MTNLKRKRDNEKGEGKEFILFGNKMIIPGNNTGRVYTCKTCYKKFSSFQALGGHRAGHNYKNPNLVRADLASGSVPGKTHECKICFTVFSTGQALGGHMTTHRTNPTKEKTKIELSNSESSFVENSVGDEPRSVSSTLVTLRLPVEEMPILERSDSWLELKLDLPSRD